MSLFADSIKLAEREFEIQTQCVTMNVARQVSSPGGGNKAASMFDKFIAKTNMKLGGLNFKIDLKSCPEY